MALLNPAATTASDMTGDIWALILQHVPLADRLGSCALVCLTFQRAAAAATARELSVSLRHDHKRSQAFQSYLKNHGEHLTSLELGDWAGGVLAELPCAALVSLSLVRGVTLPGSLFADLHHLTRLDLMDVGVAELHRVSCLTRLAVLRVEGVDNVLAPFLNFLPGIVPGIAPDFALPASLVDVQFGSTVQLNPAALSSAVQLTRLSLNGTTVEGGNGVSGGAALLAAVSGLQQLGDLELNDARVTWPPPSAAYEALTASSKLTKLVLTGWCPPGAAWVHAFPPGRVLPLLMHFDVCSMQDAETGLGVEAVRGLVRCAPGLDHLRLRALGGTQSVAELAPLIGLTSLWARLSGDVDRILARLALLPLTALRRLTDCDVDAAALRFSADNKAGPGQPPDVWQQLQRWCQQG